MQVAKTSVALALFLIGCAPSATKTGLAAVVPLDARANPAVWPVSASPAAISDPTTESAIDAVLARMTVEQKVGQLIQADISAIKAGDLEIGRAHV